MKYKVILFRDQAGTEGDLPNGAFTFYTYNAAHECAQAWANNTPSHLSWLWDGETWRYYS